MKVLLLTHIKKLGREGDIVEVADGFAINSLFPQKKAVQATAKIINEHKLKQKSQADKEMKLKQSTLEQLKTLEGKTVLIKEKLNSKGSLYHAIGAKEIISVISKQFNTTISDSIFCKKYALKEAGEHTLELEAYNKKIQLVLKIEEK